jgi:hypothetical protein
LFHHVTCHFHGSCQAGAGDHTSHASLGTSSTHHKHSASEHRAPEATHGHQHKDGAGNAADSPHQQQQEQQQEWHQQEADAARRSNIEAAAAEKAQIEAADTHTQAEAGGKVTEGDPEVPLPNRRVIAIPDLHGDMEQAIKVLQSALVIDQVRLRRSKSSGYLPISLESKISGWDLYW